MRDAVAGESSSRGRSAWNDSGPPWLTVAATTSAKLLIVAALAVAIVIVLVELRLIVLPLIAALFLTAVLDPPTQRLVRGGLPGAAAALTVLLVSLTVLIALAFLLAPRVVDQVDRLDVNISGGVDRVEEWLMEGPLGLSEGQIADATDSALDELRERSGELTRGALSSAIIVLEVIGGAIIALVLTFFLLKDGRRIWRWLVTLAPPPRRATADEAGARVWTTLGGYLRGITVAAFVEAVMVAAVLAVLGMPLVPTIAVLTFFGAFIPIVGAFVVGMLAALVALFSEGLGTAIAVVLAYVVIQQLEANLLHPVIVGRSVELHPLVVVVAVSAGAILAGVVGAFLAVPLAAVAGALLSYARERQGTPQPT